MGTISQKLTYLNDTKQLLKENINNLGGNLTNEPFRQYASVLEGIYESLPKVSGIGASLSLSPTMVGKIKLNEIQGNTLQDGTPTPSSPVPIESVTGNQNVTICGKNMLDYSTLTYGYVTNTGAVSPVHDKGEMCSDFIKVKPNTTYVFKIFETSSTYENWFGIGEYTSTSKSSFLRRDAETTGTRAYCIFTTSATTNYVRVSARNLENATKVQLEIGNATTYEAYNESTYNINLGKNLFDKSVSPSSQNGTSTIELNTGIRATVTTAGTNKYTAINLPNPSSLLGKTLTISANISISGTNTALIRFYWLNGNTLANLIANSISTTGSGQITIPSSFPANTNGIAIVFSSNSGSSTSQVGDYVDYTNVLLKKGSSSISYSPYFTPIELNKIGTYEDSIKKSTGKNLFDKDNTDIIESYFDYSNVGLLKSANGNKTLIIECKPNTTYTVSKIASTRFRIGCNNERITTGQVNSAVYGSSSDTSLTITTGANDKYLYVFYWISSDTLTEQQILDSIMINEGSTALPYEPYGKVWYITKYFNKIKLLSSFNWYASGTHTIKCLKNNLGITNIYLDYLNHPELAYNNYFVSKNASTLYQGTQAVGFGIDDGGAFYLSNNDWTLDNCKTFLTNNNVETLYLQATPTYTTITNTELIEQLETLNNAKSKNGTTNINVASEDLSMILNVGVLKGE